MTAVQQWWFSGGGGRTPLGRVVFREDFERADPRADYTLLGGGFDATDMEMVESPYGTTGAFFNTQHTLSGFTAFSRDLGREYTFNTVECKFKITNLAALDDAATLMFYLGGTQRMYFNPMREGSFDSDRRCLFSFDGVSSIVSSETPAQDVWYRMVLRIRAGLGASTVELTRLDTNTVVHTQALVDQIIDPITFDEMRFFVDSGGYTAPTVYDDIVCYNA